jgi:hypothetical protein
MTYRKLTSTEIDALTDNGCQCADWSRVEVTNSFHLGCYRRVTFSGDVKLGTTDTTIKRDGVVPLRTGIYDATIHNCTVGNEVLIRRVGNYIANYHIADNVVIENVGTIATTSETTFGNGVEVAVLNETGGREVPIYTGLSSHIAYIMAMYRHDSALIAALRQLIAARVESRRSAIGVIESHATITNTDTITNVWVGAGATIKGATRLNNGTLAADLTDPVFIGHNVIADSFIVEAGARVDDGVTMVHTFVGQATHLTRYFSAHDSLFFANCACENGEAAAIFAGPYTVTMHKSSLLIAGMFSFLNAGSGSNQSNHMYKLGPIHQGVADRGSKTASGSYILWPAHIGPFSLVMGHITSHPDTSRLPFSYLIEENGTANIVPAVNLKSVGTIRDAMKWPKRDKRRTTNKLDCLNFSLFNPYTAGRMLAGINLLNKIEATANGTDNATINSGNGSAADNIVGNFTFEGMALRPSALRKGRDLYRMALDKYFGDALIQRLNGVDITSLDAIHRRLQPTATAGEGDWVDLSGLLAPQSEITALCHDITTGAIATLNEVDTRLHAIADNFTEYEWRWVAGNFKAYFGKECTALTHADLADIISRWHSQTVALDNMLLEDARKEFSEVSHIGFGIDAPDTTADSDFSQVRGDYNSSSFVKMVQQHISNKTDLCTTLLSQLPQ